MFWFVGTVCFDSSLESRGSACLFYFCYCVVCVSFPGEFLAECYSQIVYLIFPLYFYAFDFYVFWWIASSFSEVDRLRLGGVCPNLPFLFCIVVCNCLKNMCSKVDISIVCCYSKVVSVWGNRCFFGLNCQLYRCWKEVVRGEIPAAL